jgi:drug/metabolite transporter (DMT)-like permease
VSPDAQSPARLPGSPVAGPATRVSGIRSPAGSLATGHLALAAAQVAFGLFPIFGRIVYQPGGLSPFGVLSWRLAGGALAIGSLAALAYGRRAIPARADLLRAFVGALLGVGINQGLFLVGLARSTPMNAGLVMAMIPVFTFVLAAAVGQERFSPSRAAGLAIALAGMMPLLFGGGIGRLGAHGLGNLLMAANALSYSGYLVVTKPLTERYPPLVVIAWAYVFSLVCLPFAAAGQKLLPDPGFAAAWWSLAYIVVFPTVVAYLLTMFALTRLRASTTAFYVFFQPLVTGIASWMVFGEEPSGYMLVAAAALLCGVWLVARHAAIAPPAE